ncbi:uncharacterized protein TNCV_4016121 [Trichonephila clavipes]|nr:uncharacterized protein TNCV_4016121 [Trichonephila clavipes]
MEHFGGAVHMPNYRAYAGTNPHQFRIHSSHNYHTPLEEEYSNYRKTPDGTDSASQYESLEVSEELRIAQSVISRLSQRFQDDGNVSRCYSTGLPGIITPNEDRYLAVTAKRTDRAEHQTCLVSSLQLPVRQFLGRPCTDA